MRNFKMVIIISLLISINIFANSFEDNCKKCHFAQNQLNMFMSKYTLKYSSKSKIKLAIKEYLQNPTKTKSVMPMGFINRFGLKKPTLLNEKELIKSIDEYYELYNIQKNIK